MGETAGRSSHPPVHPVLSVPKNIYRQERRLAPHCLSPEDREQCKDVQPCPSIRHAPTVLSSPVFCLVLFLSPMSFPTALVLGKGKWFCLVPVFTGHAVVGYIQTTHTVLDVIHYRIQEGKKRQKEVGDMLSNAQTRR